MRWHKALLLPLQAPYLFTVGPHPHRPTVGRTVELPCFPPPPADYSSLWHSIPGALPHTDHRMRLRGIGHGTHEGRTAAGLRSVMGHLYYVSEKLLPVCTDQVLFNGLLDISRQQDVYVPVLHSEHNGGVVLYLEPTLPGGTENFCSDRRIYLEGIPSMSGLLGNLVPTEKTTSLTIQVRIRGTAVVNHSVHPYCL